MNEFTVTIQSGGSVRTVISDGTQTLLRLIQGAAVAVHAPCGGNGTCRQCRVKVTGLCREGGEVRRCEGENVLACRVFPAGDLAAETADAAAEVVMDSESIPSGGEGTALAVDIGTTTVAAYLYDLASGRCLGRKGELNAQRSYGADVISRIRYASDEAGLDALCSAVREQIVALARSLCPDISKINYVSVAANTVMEHIFARLSPQSIGVAPFTPLSLFGEELPGRDIFPGFAGDCRVYLCPAAAGYVGGDITAGLLSSGAYLREKPVLFIDIGTNGEMALGNRDGFLCCACAAGPAFEGAGIECGSGAQTGAISRVSPDLEIEVIGGGAPLSSCGSGLIDAAAALLRSEELDETGRLEGERYRFGDKVWLSAKDIRMLQLAKAAVRAGIETLLERSGMGVGDVSEVLLAGGFGATIDPRSACAIGLLPPALLSKVRHVGNTAGKGAALALTAHGREQLARVQSLCRYEELSSSALFNEKFIDAMMFDEWEEVFHD